jgi:hypothetical protein
MQDGNDRRIVEQNFCAVQPAMLSGFSLHVTELLQVSILTFTDTKAGAQECLLTKHPTGSGHLTGPGEGWPLQ